MNHALLSATMFLIITSSTIFTLVNREQPTAYMDEIFHIPQAQNYCALHYDHWNDKITTLPGLYFASQIPLAVYSLGRVELIAQYCQVHILRLTNIVFIVGCFYIILRILMLLDVQKSSKDGDDDATCTSLLYFNALNLTMFPLLYFFAFLYYTDVGSTFFVLLCYYNSLNDNNVMASFVGCVAVMFRQTNIIWVGFAAVTSILRYLNNTVKDENIIEDVVQLIKGCFLHYKSVVRIAVPYLTVLVGFVGFVIVNDGIVVGDRTMHEASFNAPQILYLSLFTLFFSSFLVTRYLNPARLRNMVQTLTVKKIVACVIISCVMFLTVWKFTYIHKYLVADNRHYTFYVWRKIINRHPLARYALIPVYLASWVLIMSELGCNDRTQQTSDVTSQQTSDTTSQQTSDTTSQQTSNNTTQQTSNDTTQQTSDTTTQQTSNTSTQRGCSMVWCMLFFLCCCASLIPQKLLEFRYFIVPYLLFRLHVRRIKGAELCVEFLLYSLVNMATLYLFIRRTFYWEGDASPQRFMW